ncbi:hypothetical protein LSCM1_07808 [Leishmania martiniquensis]|uniref:Uncharacterized protein n=1 Tax=Leishmania martiniquensis TaxID=1580590 RepID=A0A836H260_9TRYP|nr:hypothetical protein LSCM1_07808 [Leishmania martiniquensis]
MHPPFILVDARTGLHLASSNLKWLNGDVKSKSSLAALCNAVLYQWICVDENSNYVPSKDALFGFVVEKAFGTDAHGDVQYFQLKGAYLCVVFARRRHDLYAQFADRIVEEAACGHANQLKVETFLRKLTEAVLQDSIRAFFERVEVADYAVVGQGSFGSLYAGGGVWRDRCNALTGLVGRTFTSGIHASGDLTYYVNIRDDFVFAVVVFFVSMPCIEEMIEDGIFFLWSLTCCSTVAL